MTAPPHPPVPSPLPSARPRPHPLLPLSAAVFTLLAAVGVLPDLLFGLDRHSPFAQLVAFRPLILAVGAGALVLLLVVLRFRRRAWPFVAGLTAVLLVGGALVLPRVVADAVPAGGTPLTVLSYNVFEGRADADALADLIRSERPDLVALPEGGERFLSRITPLVESLGYRSYSTPGTDDRDIANVAALVAADLGPVQVSTSAETSPLPWVGVTGGRLGALRFVAYHSAAPVPGSVAQWRSDLVDIRQWCAGPTPAVVAGDFNATLDHSAMREGMAGCGDAAAQRGEGLAPTWGPSVTSRGFGPQIDHVLATTGIVAETFSVHDLPGSDHRAILARLRRP